MIDYKIWCTYHDKNLIDKYDLKETENFKLYYTKGELKNEISLNYIQEFLNEWVTQYYVWKNNIKSDIVGFCHYRRNILPYINEDILNHILNYSQYRTFITIPLSNIIKDNYSYNCNDSSILLDQKLFGLNLHYDLFINYVKENYSQYIYNRSLEVLNCNYARQNFGEIFVCKWNIFNDLMIFVEGYLKFLFNKLLNLPIKELHEYTHEEYNDLSYYLNNENFRLRSEFLNNLRKENIIIENIQFAGYPRCLAFIIESLIGSFWNIFINGNSYNNIITDIR